MTIAHDMAVAIDNANLYENLVAKTEMLETLHDIGKELSSILDLEQFTNAYEASAGLLEIVELLYHFVERLRNHLGIDIDEKGHT